ncbi:hypothetical protein Tco_0033863 [Tanacetum coccineum]
MRSSEVVLLKLFVKEIEVSKSDEKMGDLRMEQFVMDVKFAIRLANTNFDHLFCLFEKHEAHANMCVWNSEQLPRRLELRCRRFREDRLRWYARSGARSNVISYEQYLQETQNKVVQDTNSSAQQDAMIMSVIEEMSNQVDFQNQIHMLKLQLSATVESHKTLSTTVDVLKKESKAKEDKYLEEIIDLEKKKKALDNVVYKMGQSTQTMHMLTKPQVFYDESYKTALGYQNPLYLTQAQRKVLALYCGRTIIRRMTIVVRSQWKKTLLFGE